MIIGTVVLAIMVALVLVIIEARVLVLVLVFTKHQEGRTHFADKCHWPISYTVLCFIATQGKQISIRWVRLGQSILQVCTLYCRVILQWLSYRKTKSPLLYLFPPKMLFKYLNIPLLVGIHKSII